MTYEEERAIAHECRAAEVLDSPSASGDLGTAHVNTSETLPVGCARRHGFLHRVGVNHETERVFNLGFGGVLVQSADRSAGIFVSAYAD